MRKSLSILLFALMLASCSTSKYTYRDTVINNKSVLSNQLMVDTKVDLSKKIQSSSSKRESPEAAVEEAYFKAITENNIDVVIDPIFEVKTTDKFLFFGGKSTAKLIGFGGKYENIRTKTEAVMELKKVDTLDIKKFNDINYYPLADIKKSKQNPSDVVKKNKNWLITAGSILLGVLLFK